MPIIDIFQRKSTHLTWFRLPDGHVLDANDEVPESADAEIEADAAYFVVRMREMYVRYTRQLWRKLYPMLHGFVEYGGQEEHSVAGPGQLKELGEANLERIINLNHRLAGPTPYKGGDVSILIGLYSVPGQDVTRVLIDTISALAQLGGVALGQATQIATATKAGVERILGLDEARLELGVRDTFYRDNPLRAGHYLGVNARASDVQRDKMWLRNGRLVSGVDPVAGKPYESHDYLVLQVERRAWREDWAGLPGLAEFEEKFKQILGATDAAAAQKRERLRTLWPTFTEAVVTSPHLVRTDATRIAEAVGKDLNARLSAMELGNPFETRSWTGSRAPAEPGEYDFLSVANELEADSARVPARSDAALEQLPF